MRRTDDVLITVTLEVTTIVSYMCLGTLSEYQVKIS